jgi:D-alanyl-D-alanine carboxypeptidase
MRVLPWHLVNSEHVEAWPAHLLRARGNADARALAQARWCLRRKRDGRYLACFDGHKLRAMVDRLDREPGLAQALGALDGPFDRAGSELELPLAGLRERLQRLGIGEDYGQRTGLDLVAEPARLEFAGHDRFRRPLWLRAPAARAWLAMRAAAREDGVLLQAISGYRSHDYQLGIFERKLARGLSLEQILAVNAAPGYSEHHGGLALDIGTPGEPPAEESFEATPAFAWLHRRAGEFGFRLSYPRGNRHGIVYEPWHWCWHPPEADGG